jgi:hypothetical protein
MGDGSIIVMPKEVRQFTCPVHQFGIDLYHFQFIISLDDELHGVHEPPGSTMIVSPDWLFQV